MARIRHVKPDFFRHGKLQDLEKANPGAHVMLVFAGLWTQCDRLGHFPWDARQLKLDILPFLEFDMTATLEILSREKFIAQYEADGDCYGEVLTFKEHQRITGKEAESPPRYPEPTRGKPGKRRGSAGETPGNQQGAQGNGERVMEKGERVCDTHTIPPDLDWVRAYCLDRSNGLDAEKWWNFYASKGWMVGKNKMKDWQAAVRTWEGNQHGSQNGSRGGRESASERNSRKLFENLGGSEPTPGHP